MCLKIVDNFDHETEDSRKKKRRSAHLKHELRKSHVKMNIITNTVYMYVSDFETIPISAPLLKLANAGATSVPMEKSSGSPKFLAMW